MDALFPDGIYYIQNAGTGTVLELKDGSPEDNGAVQCWKKRPLSDNLASAQMWIVQRTRPEIRVEYTIRNAAGRTCLNPTGPDNGSTVVGFEENPIRGPQYWLITLDTNQSNFYVIENLSAHKYMELKDGNPENGATIQIWDSRDPTTDNKNQLWNFSRV